MVDCWFQSLGDTPRYVAKSMEGLLYRRKASLSMRWWGWLKLVVLIVVQWWQDQVRSFRGMHYCVLWEIVVVKNFGVGQLALANRLFLHAGVQGSEYYFWNFQHFLQTPYFELYANCAFGANFHFCRVAENVLDSIVCSRSSLCDKDRCDCGVG